MQTDGHDYAVALRNFANAPKKFKYIGLLGPKLAACPAFLTCLWPALLTSGTTACVQWTGDSTLATLRQGSEVTSLLGCLVWTGGADVCVKHIIA